MSIFEAIKQKHLGDKPLHYLWELKVTDSEYVELKELLAKYSRSFSRNASNRFITVCKECALMIAEFWRREYIDGAHSKEMVFNAIDPSITDEDVINEFYDAAKRGAGSLKLEIYESDGRKQYLDSMLYQGGLPMKLVTENVTNSVWDRFTRGLVNRKINFEELNLGLVASNNKCLKAYCDQISIGVDKRQFKLMPFYCQNENDPWFLYLKELAKQERIRRRQQHPIKLYVEFEIDHIEKKIYTKYVFNSSQHLNQAFLDEQNLSSDNFFSIQVKKNNRVEDTFDFIHNFCRYPVVSKHQYQEGDSITVYLSNQDDPYLSEELDMDVPRLLYKDNDDNYISGNRLGKSESFLLIPDGWNVVNESVYTIHKYTLGGKSFRGILIDSNYTSDIIVEGSDGTITFGMNATLYWTDIQNPPLYYPDVIEPIYDAEKCSFALCNDKEDGIGRIRRSVQYRNKWQSEWDSNPSFGEIFARAEDNHGKYVTPVKLVNIGEGLQISVLQAEKDTCQIKVIWPHGKVSTREGELKANGAWLIKKENCHNPRIIHFLFAPNNNSRNQFTLSVKAPFKDFSIIDINGDNIENDCWIPYSDVDKYQYHLVGQDIKEFSYGNISRQVRWRGDKLQIIENGTSLRSIPYEGSLASLFDSREIIRSLLDKTSQSMVNAEVKVQIKLSDGQSISFCIKDSPFRVNQTDNGRVIINGNHRTPVKFTGVLKLLKLSDPKHDSIDMHFNHETGCYQLPEEIRPWGKTILIGRSRGRICPALVDLTREMDVEYRVKNRENAINQITKDLNDANNGIWNRTIGWFERTQEEDIPASSILELHCTAQDHKFLFILAFLLFIKCQDEHQRNVLKDNLESFSNDLAFQWYWLKPYFSNIMVELYSALSHDSMTDTLQQLYIHWAMEKGGEDTIKYLSALNIPETYNEYFGLCFQEVVFCFTEWLEDICISSLSDTYLMSGREITKDIATAIIKESSEMFHIEENDTYIDFNQDRLSTPSDEFFKKYEEQGKTENEQWLYKRMNAVAAHFNGEIDLFAQDDEIRRSIIYCCKSCNKQFVIILNNKLCH